MIVCLLAAFAGLSGWNVIAELHTEGSPTNFYKDADGDYHLEMPADSSVIDHVFGADGQFLENRELSGQVAGSSSFSFISIISETDMRSFGIACLVDGDTLWKKDLGFSICDGEFPGMILPVEAGGCYAVYSPMVNTGVWHAVRLDSAGNCLFQSEFQLFGGPLIFVSQMAETDEGGVVFTGVTDDRGMNLYMFLIAFSPAGELLFRHSDSLRFHGCGEIVQTDSRGITVAGYTGYERDDGFFLPPVETDVFLIRFDNNGIEQWRTVLELPLENHVRAMSTAGDGSIAMAVSAYSYEEEDYSRIVLLNYTPDGI